MKDKGQSASSFRVPGAGLLPSDTEIPGVDVDPTGEYIVGNGKLSIPTLTVHLQQNAEGYRAKGYMIPEIAGIPVMV